MVETADDIKTGGYTRNKERIGKGTDDIAFGWNLSIETIHMTTTTTMTKFYLTIAYRVVQSKLQLYITNNLYVVIIIM